MDPLTSNHRPIADQAKNALERVCSGAGLDKAACYYAPSFVDHVNDLEFHGLEGADQSVALYGVLLSNISVSVEEQVIAADRVTSRFVVTGQVLGRRARFNGITISRFENGLIVEDWSVVDTAGMLRQLGVLRSLVVAARWMKHQIKACRHEPKHSRGASREPGATCS